MKYKTKYDNDVGPQDDYFIEWTSVVEIESDRVICKCDDSDDAEYICSLLNENDDEKRVS